MYSAYDRELLATYSAVKHFQHMLEARHFILFTDHKPLTFAIKQNSEKFSPRPARQLDFIEQFSMSRIETIKAPVPVDYGKFGNCSTKRCGNQKIFK